MSPEAIAAAARPSLPGGLSRPAHAPAFNDAMTTALQPHPAAGGLDHVAKTMHRLGAAGSQSAVAGVLAQAQNSVPTPAQPRLP